MFKKNKKYKTKMAEIRNMNSDEGENENSHDVRGLHCLTEAWAKKSEFLQN